MMMKRVGAFLLAAGLAACGGDQAAVDNDLEPEDLVGEADEGKADAWNRANNPTYVDSTFLTMMSQLPTSGDNRKPIPGDYWAVAHDGINHKWHDSGSPADKYGRLVGRDIREQVSQENGVKSQSGNKTCSTNADCTSLMDGSICATSYDNSMKRCIPTWFGICHGWAPYAIAEPQAKKAVTRNGVTFYPADLDALMSMLYTDIDSKFISQRCNRGGAGDPITYDSLGRPVYGECADMNAGTWHVVVGNMIGLRKKGFVLDQTLNYEVWNQPTWKYDSTVREVDAAEANRLVGGGSAGQQLFAGAVRAQERKTGVFRAPAAGQLVFALTGMGDADMAIRKGAAPTDETYDCRPYEATSKEECKIDVAAGDEIHWAVAGYETSSDVALNVSGAGINSGVAGGTYQFNPQARKFWAVDMNFTFVVETGPSTSMVDAADSAKTERYTYVVEGDAAGNIIGGEWTGDSKIKHPDFAWWLTRGPQNAVAGIDYATVKSLNDEAAEVNGGAPQAGEVSLLSNSLLPYTLTKRSIYLAVEVPTGVKKVTVRMEGSGDADLLIGKKGEYPRVYGSNLCESETKGTSVESCTFDVTAGTYYARVRNRAAGSTVSVFRSDQR